MVMGAGWLGDAFKKRCSGKWWWRFIGGWTAGGGRCRSQGSRQREGGMQSRRFRRWGVGMCWRLIADGSEY